jgi:hypothetical protein
MMFKEWKGENSISRYNASAKKRDTLKNAKILLWKGPSIIHGFLLYVGGRSWNLTSVKREG